MYSTGAPPTRWALGTHCASPGNDDEPGSNGNDGGGAAPAGATGAAPPDELGSASGAGADPVGALCRYHQFSTTLTNGAPPWSRTHSTVRTCQLALPG